MRKDTTMGMTMNATAGSTPVQDPELVLMNTLLEHVESKGVGPVRGAELARAVRAAIAPALDLAAADQQDAEKVRRAVDWVVNRAELAEAAYLSSERGRKSRRAEGKRDESDGQDEVSEDRVTPNTEPIGSLYDEGDPDPAEDGPEPESAETVRRSREANARADAGMEG